MPVIRTYKCNDCGDLFEIVLESGNDADPPCPYCEKELQWRPGMFSIKTNKSRALDLTQKIVEQDFGLSDLRDNLREGDVAAKTAPRTQADIEKDAQIAKDIQEIAQNPDKMHPLARSFFGGQQAGPFSQQNVDVKSAIANVKGSVPDDRNPMAMLSEAGKKGQLPINYRLLNEHGREFTVKR
jgi:hypothetical protein